MSNSAVRKKLGKEIARLRTKNTDLESAVGDSDLRLAGLVEQVRALNEFFPDADTEGTVGRMQALARVASDLGWDQEAATLARVVGLVVESDGRETVTSPDD